MVWSEVSLLFLRGHSILGRSPFGHRLADQEYPGAAAIPLLIPQLMANSCSWDTTAALFYTSLPSKAKLIPTATGITLVATGLPRESVQYDSQPGSISVHHNSNAARLTKIWSLLPSIVDYQWRRACVIAVVIGILTNILSRIQSDQYCYPTWLRGVFSDQYIF